jgi:hypothetical protein
MLLADIPDSLDHRENIIMSHTATDIRRFDSIEPVAMTQK